MSALFHQFFQLALLRASPADMPAGWTPVSVAAVFSVVVAVFYQSLITDPGLALVTVVLELMLSAGFLWSCLSASGHAGRLPQALTGIYGAGGVVVLFAVPWALTVRNLDVESLPLWAVAWYVALLCWSLMVHARVLQLAGGFSVAVSALLALAYLWVSMVLFQALLG